MNMNKKRIASAAGVIAAVMVLATCAGTGKPVQKTQVLDDKGAAYGIGAPEWVQAYVSGGNHIVEQLSEYKNEHCFVVEYMDKNRDFAVNWVQNADGPAQVARMVSSTVLTDAKEKSAGKRGEDVNAAFESAAHAMSEASFTELRRIADWWQIVRNKDTKMEECRAMALYTVDKKSLDAQIAANLANIIENNRELSEAAREIYRELIADIRANGFNNR